MDDKKKTEICDRYAAWANTMSLRACLYMNPANYMTFRLWIEYNAPEHVEDAYELYDFFNKNYKNVAEQEYSESSFDPWID